MTDETHWKLARLWWMGFVTLLVLLFVLAVADTIWERYERWYYFEQPLFDDLPQSPAVDRPHPPTS
jgi:hypothetical protein